MEFKGSKGKWEVDRYNNVSANYNEIAFLKSDTPNEERRANAQLIAHAPEMLEMLQSLHHCIDWSVSMWGDDSGQVLKEKIEQLLQRATTI